jgi:TolA-binding protein
MIADVFDHIPSGFPLALFFTIAAGLAVLTLLATLALQAKKLFGRQPSLDSILSGLVTVGVLEDFKGEQHRRARGLEEQISKLRHDVDAALNSSIVREGERGKEIQTMRDIVARLQERTETHIRKLDRYDDRFDRMLREWSTLKGDRA